MDTNKNTELRKGTVVLFVPQFQTSCFLLSILSSLEWSRPHSFDQASQDTDFG